MKHFGDDSESATRSLPTTVTKCVTVTPERDIAPRDIAIVTHRFHVDRSLAHEQLSWSCQHTSTSTPTFTMVCRPFAVLLTSLQDTDLAYHAVRL